MKFFVAFIGGIVGAIIWGFVTLGKNLIYAPKKIHAKQRKKIQNKRNKISVLKNELSPRRIQSRVNLVPTIRKERNLISIKITNNNQQNIELYGLLLSILNPHEKNIIDKINPIRSKLSWDGGTKTGTKRIDYNGPPAYLNIAEHIDNRLRFIFRSWNEGFADEVGEYKISGELRGNMEEIELRIPFCSIVIFGLSDILRIKEC